MRLSAASPSSLLNWEKLSEQMSARCLGLRRFGGARRLQQALQDEIDELEMRWLELSELLG